MSPIGERGGSTTSLPDGEALIDLFKPEWSAVIRDRIATVLADTGAFHAADLLDLEVPAEHKNAIGATIGSFVRQGLLEETGVRRSSGDKAGHARKSAVYRITKLGREKLAGVGVSDTNASRAADADSGHISPDSGPSVPEGVAGRHACDSPPPQLFDSPVPQKRPGQTDLDQRAA